MITIKQMLEIGKECGLSDIEQAYSQVMTHYDVFFFGSKEQGKFNDELRNSPFVENNFFKDLTIDECLEKLVDL